MELQFSEEQVLLRNTIEKMCVDHSDLSTLSYIEDSNIGYSEDFWNQIINLGLTGINIPKDFGGSDMGLLDQVILYEEFGRALSLSPHMTSSIICSSLINKLGTTEQKKEILEEIVSGKLVMTLAWLEEGSSFYKHGISFELIKRNGDIYANGKKHMVPYASTANKMLLLFKESDQIGIAIVNTDQSGISLNYQHNHAKTSLYEVSFDDVLIEKSNIINSKKFWEIWLEIASIAQVLIAAEVHMLELSQEERTATHSNHGLFQIAGLLAISKNLAWMKNAQESTINGMVIPLETDKSEWLAGQSRDGN